MNHVAGVLLDRIVHRALEIGAGAIVVDSEPAADIEVDRKILSDLAISDPAGFKAIAAQAGIQTQG